MGLLQKAVNEQAFLKAGIFGNAGSGKTTSAAYLAMAIATHFGKKKPIAFFETEAGSDFLIEKFQTEGIELLRVKSHSLADLLAAAREAEASCAALIVDSVSHIWENLCKSKLDAVNAARKRKGLYLLEKLDFQHWADVKRQWAAWTDLYLNSKLHIIVCGRAGGVWEFDTNDETGKKELQKVGSKMKAEGEFGYEPSLLVEMERVSKGGEAGAGWKHCAIVLKDRTDTINGLRFEFEKPRKEYKAGDWKSTFKPFEPVFKRLNIGGAHHTFDPARTSETLFEGPEGESRGAERGKMVGIALEEIEASLTMLWPGQDKDSKLAKVSAVDTLFGVRSWTAVEGMRLEALQIGQKALRNFESVYKNGQFESLGDVMAALKVCKERVEESAKPAPLELVDDDLPDSFKTAPAQPVQQ